MNIIDYASTCFMTFDELPFNEIDAVILSQMSYLYIEENFANNYSDAGMTVDQLMRAELFEEMCRALPLQKELTQMIYAFVASPRYRNARIKYYRNELDPGISLQFAAMVFSFSDQMHCICYRGTDKSLVGWKEDVLLLMTKAVSCQMMSTNYLNGVAEKLKGDLYITGHSKGGHLAAYAAAHCKKEVQDRILQVYDLDGPGFSKQELALPGMKAIQDRIVKFNPVESPVGAIMLDEAAPIIIKSSSKGFMQHNAFTWLIQDNCFIVAEDRSNILKKIVRNINTWAETASDDKILLFAEVFFGIFESEEFDTYDDLGASPRKTLKLASKNFKETDPAKRKEMLGVLYKALRGVKQEKSHSDEEDLREFGVDWNQIELLMNEIETEMFNKEYSLFL